MEIQSRFVWFLVLFSSSALVETGGNYDCRLSSKVTVKWIECSPYIHHVKNSVGNSSDVQAEGIIPTALEVLSNASNLSIKYEAPLRDMAGLKKLYMGNYSKKSDLIVFPCLSMKTMKFEDEYENSEAELCTFGKMCPVKITDSYGPVFMTKQYVIQPVELTVRGLKKCWKTIVVTLLMACLAGIALWIVERKKNSDEFPKDFINGSWQGFWWALVTMTTVGYGDKVPKSVSGRLITICWMIVGMVFFSILTGTMAAALFMTDETESTTMFGKRVAVLADSEDVEVAIRESAHIVEYSTVADIIQAMENNEISFLLLDRFIVNAYSTEFSRFNFKVTKLIDQSYSYFVFAMRSDTKFPQNLERCYKAQTLFITKAIKRMQTEMWNKHSITQGEVTENIMDHNIIIILSGVLAFSLCLGAIWQRYQSKNAIDDKDSEVINQEVKLEYLDSTYNSIVKKERFSKCESCRQCKLCNPG